jgi:predicted transcriptional regulator
MNTVKLQVRGFQDVLSDVAQACKKGTTLDTRISFASVEDLWKTISPKKMDILKVMTGAGEMGIREISRKVGRDVSAIHRDIQALILAGVVQRTDNGKVVFPYDVMHVDFTITPRVG